MKNQNAYMPQDVYIPYFGLEKPLVGIEIGVGAGDGSLTAMHLMPNLSMYCIDPWIHVDGQPFELGGHDQARHDNAYKCAVERLGNFGTRATIIKKKSDDAINDVPDEVDFIFIDGHHEYSQVVKDINNYAPKVRSGGIIAGHDYLQVYDVTRAVYEFFMNKEAVHFGEDFTWWVYVKEPIRRSTL